MSANLPVPILAGEVLDPPAEAPAWSCQLRLLALATGLREQPVAEGRDRRIVRVLWAAHHVIGERAVERRPEWTHKAVLRQILPDECRAAERHAVAGDHHAERRRRVVDVHTTFALGRSQAGTLVPIAPGRESRLRGHGRVVDERVVA